MSRYKKYAKYRTASEFYSEEYFEGDIDSLAYDTVTAWEDEGGNACYDDTDVWFQMMLSTPDVGAGLAAPYFAKNKKVHVKDVYDAADQLAAFIKECSEDCTTSGFPPISKLETHPEVWTNGTVFIPMWPHTNKGAYGIPDGFSLEAYNAPMN